MTTPTQIIEDYIKEQVKHQKLVSFAEFFERQFHLIVKHSESENLEELERAWSSRFGAIAKKIVPPTINITLSKPDWKTISQALLANKIRESNNSTCSSSNERNHDNHFSPSTTQAAFASASTETSNSGLPVSLTAIKSRYEGIDKETMWLLSTGKRVEEKMMERALQCTTEHPSHSIILDVDDPMWVKGGYFTSDEMQEIRALNSPTLPSVPEQVNEYLKRYDGKHTKKEIFEVAKHELFDPITEAGLHWVHQTMFRALNLFNYNYLPITDHTEQDIVHRVWGFVQEAFDATKFDVRCGEKACAASSEAKNGERSLSGDALTRKLCGKKVDLLVKHVCNEYACAEAGKNMTSDSTKELIESNLLCPKTMRDMMCKLTSSNPEKLHKIVTGGFIFMGLRMSCLIMTCPKGNVCRVQRIGPLMFPDDEQNFVARMKSLIRTMFKVKALLESSLEIVLRDDEDRDPDFHNPTLKCPLQHSYHHQLPPPKRRRVGKASNTASTTTSTDS